MDDHRRAAELLQLKDHLMSDRPNVWAVANGSGQIETFDNYGAALSWYEQTEARFWARLSLYTRKGTAVVLLFRAGD